MMDNVSIDPVIIDRPTKDVEGDVLNGSAIETKTADSKPAVESEVENLKLNLDDPGTTRAINDDPEQSRPENVPNYSLDPKVVEQRQLIEANKPSTALELALYDELQRKNSLIERLSGEVLKLKQFVSKRKQVYKRKRKHDGAPTRALSAYNIFVQDRFSRLAKENEEALKSCDTDAKLRRVPPSSLVASTGTQWKELPAEQKSYYEERAKADRKRYEEEMAKYQPPDKNSNRKRNKTGYNMFFTFHVNQMKEDTEAVPSERGSVARRVGNAWKELSNEEKLRFEEMADRQNTANSDDDNQTFDDVEKRRPMEYGHAPPVMAIDPNAHRQAMPPQMGHVPVIHQPAHHDPRMYPPPPGPHGPYQPYPPPPPGYYDYPPQPYPQHAPPQHHPPPPLPEHQHGTGQRNDNQDRNGQHEVPSPSHPGHATHLTHPPHAYPAPPHPHHHHFHPHPHPPPPPHYNPQHMEQR